MKKVLLLLCFMLLTAAGVYAVPANPRPITVTQSDGTSIRIIVRGDEFFHYTTTTDDINLVQEDGIYYYAVMEGQGLRSSGIKANDAGKRTSQELRFISSSRSVKGAPVALMNAGMVKRQSLNRNGLTTGFPTKGEIRSLVILVNFSDLVFESPTANEDFDRLLNEIGYSDNGATGSARDYFDVASSYQFKPTFDVIGPVTVSKSYEYYGKNKPDGDDNDAEGMIAEACRLADEAGVNFADYDYNNDDIVDNVFVFYAGTNEADGGGADKIWPHRYQLPLGEVVLDGKSVFIYACTSEKKMHYEGPKMAGIGTFVHEFTHVLGLPDLYDTDGYVGGTSQGVSTWSLMCNGPYLNESRTPPTYSAVERMLADWIEIEEIEYSGEYTLENLEESNKAYMMKTDTEGEYFVLENRQNSKGWDKYLDGHGMLIYHVDRSTRDVDGMTAIDRWEYNMPNNVVAHECMRIVSASITAGAGDEESMPYPGESGNTSFTRKSVPANKSWSGEFIETELNGIKETSGVITFKAKTDKGEMVNVTGVEIRGNKEVALNDTAHFKAVISPANAMNRNVTWESLTPQTASINNDGIVKALKEGTGKVKVTTEDGGYTAEFEFTITLKQLLRARVITSNGAPVKDASIDLESGSQVYQLTADENGIIYYTGLPKGEYMLRISGTSMPSQTKVMELAEGASVCDIIVFTEEELAKGTSSITPDTSIYEDSAYLKWNDSGNNRWRVEWYPSDDPSKKSYEFTEYPKMDISGLDKETAYTAIIYEFDEVVDSHFSIVEFTTKAPSGEFVTILLDSMYEKGDSVLLKCANAPQGAKLQWKVNGEVTDATELLLEESEYEIELTVESSEDTEIITKYIQVIGE